MADEKKEKWLNYLALTTVIFAVCATLSTFKGGGQSTKSVLSQSQASNQWAYYQAKSIKGYLYELQQEKLELELRAFDPRTRRLLGDDYKRKIEGYAKKIKQYNEEKTAIEQEARTQEKIRDDAQLHSRAFGMAVIFLQIAILLSSIAALLKRKIIWVLGLSTGTFGLVYFADGFLLLWK